MRIAELIVQKGLWTFRVLTITSLLTGIGQWPLQERPQPSCSAMCRKSFGICLFLSDRSLFAQLFPCSAWQSCSVKQGHWRKINLFLQMPYIYYDKILFKKKVTAVIGQSDPISLVVKHNYHSKSFKWCLHHGWVACAEGMLFCITHRNETLQPGTVQNSCGILFETSSEGKAGIVDQILKCLSVVQTLFLNWLLGKHAP